MNIQQNLQMEKSAFLAWIEGREGRYELAGGQVVMMTGSTIGHQFIVANVFRILVNRLDRNSWLVLTDPGVDVGPKTVRYPDLVVLRPGAKVRDMTVETPVLVVEVLSPSTTKTDFGDKAVEYLQLPSVAAYLILAQDEVKGWVYVRNSPQLPGPEPVEGREATIHIPALDVALSLADIYDGIEFDE